MSAPSLVAMQGATVAAAAAAAAGASPGAFAPSKAATAGGDGPAFFCAACGVQASSAVSYQDHCKGKRHASAVRRSPGAAPGFSGGAADDHGERAAAAAGSRSSSHGGDAGGKGGGKGVGDRKPRRAAPPPSLKPPPALQDMGPMSAQRRSLPVFGYREELLRTIAANRVVVVEGETGTQRRPQTPPIS
jgi:hypothetical protein